VRHCRGHLLWDNTPDWQEDDMTVGEACNREVVICGGSESVVEAARRMKEFHVGDLVVTEDRAGTRVPVAILTDRDLVLRVIVPQRTDLTNVPVSEVCTVDLVTAPEEESLHDALDRMRSAGIRRLPVVNAEGGLEGLLTFDDVVELLASELTDLAKLTTKQQRRERVRSH
jgi:CBS domain-containing protein